MGVRAIQRSDVFGKPSGLLVRKSREFRHFIGVVVVASPVFRKQFPCLFLLGMAACIE
jgi:hypothetical protein